MSSTRRPSPLSGAKPGMTQPTATATPSSPLANIRAQRDQLPATPRRTGGSPLARPENQVIGARQILMPVTDEAIEKLGADLPTRISTTVNNITSRVSTAQFADLGDLLAELTVNADKLDPNNYGKIKGIRGWFRNAVVDVRKLMIKNLQSASESFGALENKMVEQIQIHKQWIKDLDTMYKENEQNYHAICRDIQTAEEWCDEMKRILANLPPIDPASDTAMMQANMIRKAEATLNRCSRKADTFRRTRVLVENIAPKILAQQEASDATIGTYQELITQSLPMVKLEFALHMQSLEVKRDAATQTSIKAMNEKAIITAADSAAEAIVASAENANAALISNDALNHTRNAILGAITQVRQIEQTAQARREDDARMMIDSQSKYLKDLQGLGAV